MARSTFYEYMPPSNKKLANGGGVLIMGLPRSGTYSVMRAMKIWAMSRCSTISTCHSKRTKSEAADSAPCGVLALPEGAHVAPLLDEEEPSPNSVYSRRLRQPDEPGLPSRRGYKRLLHRRVDWHLLRRAGDTVAAGH